MGKRKERRLAALSNTGRRVKLDLFAEPSGDLGGSSVHDEVGGGDSNPTQGAGLPNSPSSSSGQQPQNPLLLLGQYSDDELDEEKDKNLNNAPNDSPSADLSKQDIHPAEGNDKDSNAVQDPVIQSNNQQDMDADSTGVDGVQSTKGVDHKDHGTAVHGDTSNPFISSEQASEGGFSTPQVAGDVSLGWRMVLHEESNQYYYWNPGTGETSWEVPIAFSQMGYAGNLEASVAEDTWSLPVSKIQNDPVCGVELAHSFPASTIDGSSSVICGPLREEARSSMQQMDVSHQPVESEPSKSESLATRLHQSELENNSGSFHGQSGEENVAQDEPRHATNIQKEVADTSTSLRTQCQCLLERLKSLKGFDRWPQDRERMLKYIIELETRLSDIESLSSYGLALLPFWMHSEGRLKQLEDEINSEIYRLAVSAQMDEDIEPTTVVSEGKQQHQDGLYHESPTDGAESSKSPTTVNVMDSSRIEGAPDSVSYAVHTSPPEAAGKVSESAAVNAEVNMTAELKPDLVGIEDVDMDIDMEVEDAPASTTLSETHIHTDSVPSEQFIPSNAPEDYTSLVAGESSAVPPPPEEEWIPPPPPDTEHVPPPPPDDEQIPPPPPDEPPDSSCSMLTCSGQMVQPASYTDHYSYPYMDSNFQYYGSASTLPSGSFYAHVDGSQVAIPHTSLYYGPVSTTYAETPPVMVNPVEQVASFNHLQTFPPGTLLTGLESSNLQTNVATVQSDSSYMLNAADSVEAGQYVKPQQASNVNSQAPDVSNDEGTVSATSVNVLVAAAAASAPSNAKVQSKVSRGKKRSVAVSTSLRSNKKVSSLVDKWKAAKEELKENDEDEPENALEILEKKRQREIEEWRAKQITSGEAKDNANFQPLGGDWREKVKRKRALAAKEEAKKGAEVDVAADAKQQPSDLAEVSKGLPSGWQVYWDEASEQVYYGNALTSETSWTRPAAAN